MTVMAAHTVVLVPETHATIQEAIDAATGPTTIVVAPGVYRESLVVRGREYVVVQSARLSRRGVRLEGSGAGAVVTVESSALFLSGVVIGSHAASRGIVARDATVSLPECVVSGNRAGDGDEPFGAGMLCRRSKVHLQKSVISGNVIEAGASGDAGGAGIFLDGCDAEIAGCTIQLNEVRSGGGARGGGLRSESTKLRMWKSRVTDNALSAASCEGGGIWIAAGRDTQLGGCVISGNDAGDGSGGGVFVAAESPGVSIHRNSFVRQNHPDDVFRVER